MAVTIKDVAKKAGVAPSTVSRVLQDSPSISESTKEKVRRVMEELDYYPNTAARQLVNRKTNLVGLVLPEDSDAFYQNQFFPTVLRGISDETVKANYSVLLISGKDSKDRLKKIEQIVRGKAVDGLIFVYATDYDPLLEFAIKQDIPLVVIGRSEENVNYVNNDNVKAAYDATKELLKLNYKNIAFIGGDSRQIFINDRFEGYKKALEEAGISVKQSLVYNNGRFLPTYGQGVVRSIVDQGIVDAIVTADELVATGIDQSLTQAGSDIVQVTFRAFDSNMNPRNNPTIGFIDIQARLLGQEGFLLLHEKMHEKTETVKQTLIDHTFIPLY